MPTKSFALEANGPQRLNISWRAQYKKLFVSLDGNTIGIIHDKKDLSAGQEFGLPDGSTIKVQLIRILTEIELQVLRNGQPLPGSASDPKTRLKNAYQIVLGAAGVCIIISLVSVFFSSEPLPLIGNGFALIWFGVVLIPLGLFVRQKSVVALFFAIVVWIGFNALVFYLSLQDYYSAVGVLVYIYSLIYFLVPMFLGFGAINALKNQT